MPTQTFTAPPCAASGAHRGALWRRLLTINRAHRRKGTQGPFTGVTRLVFDWLLWKAPRGAGVLIPSMAFIAREAAISLASVKRAVRTLQAWGLLRVHARLRAVSWPVRVGERIHMIRKAMRTSNAYSFPAGLPDFRQGQSDPVAKPSESLEKASARDWRGRWISAVVRRKLAEVAGQSWEALEAAWKGRGGHLLG
jgi:DNA-binding transcriptional MocR family regulator